MVAGCCSDEEDREIVVRRSDMEEDGGMSSARRWMEIVDGGGGAVMRCRKVVKIIIRELRVKESCEFARLVVVTIGQLSSSCLRRHVQVLVSVKRR